MSASFAFDRQGSTMQTASEFPTQEQGCFSDIKLSRQLFLFPPAAISYSSKTNQYYVIAAAQVSTHITFCLFFPLSVNCTFFAFFLALDYLFQCAASFFFFHSGETLVIREGHAVFFHVIFFLFFLELLC